MVDNAEGGGQKGWASIAIKKADPKEACIRPARRLNACGLQ